MSITKIRAYQIATATATEGIDGSQLAVDADIALSQLAEGSSLIKNDGTVSMTAELTVVDATAQTSAVSKGQLDGSVSTLQAAVDAEVTARTDADTTLQAAVDAEVTARTDADTTLQSNIDAEITARTDADATLQAALDAEITARTESTEALDAEVTARTDADATLQANIDAEITARTDADATLQAALDAEITARTDADVTLQANINAEITARTDADLLKLDLAGGTMTGNIIMTTGTSITLADAPAVDTDAVNKAYVDAYIAGLTWKNSVVAYANTNIDLATGGELTVDGVVLVVGDRVLVNGQDDDFENGIYVVSAGSWTRSVDMDQTTPVNEINSAAVWVEMGDVYADTGWTQVLGVNTLGTDPISFTQFNGAAGFVAGVGLTKDGNTVNVSLGAGIAQLPTDEVGIDLYANGGLDLVDPTTGLHSELTDAVVSVKLDGTSLVLSANGLAVSSGVLNDITTLQNDLDAEVTARTDADATLQASIDAEVTARTDADATLQAAVDAEVTARTDADATLQANIDTEITARTDADATLQAAVDAEVTARTDADVTLQANINAEITARTDADVTLQANIDAEVTARTDADATLQAALDAEITARTESTEALDAEVTARTDADVTLQANIDAEVTARTDADATLQAALDAEITARTDADVTLQANINAEITARTDADVTLQANINAEVTARTDADQALEDMIIAIGTSTEWQKSCDSYGVTPPVSPTVGERVLVVESVDTETGVVTVGTATGDFTGQEGKIAEWDGSQWNFVTVTAGTFTSVDTVSAGIFAYVGSWSLKIFEATVAGDGLTLTGVTVGVNLHSGGGLILDGTSGGIKVDPTVVALAENIIVRDAFTGVVDGNNTVFTTSSTPVVNTEMVFLNGVLQNPGAGNDYTISGSTITFAAAPLATDVLTINFVA